jgi:hypothetical protein
MTRCRAILPANMWKRWRSARGQAPRVARSQLSLTRRKSSWRKFQDAYHSGALDELFAEVVEKKVEELTPLQKARRKFVGPPTDSNQEPEERELTIKEMYEAMREQWAANNNAGGSWDPYKAKGRLEPPVQLKFCVEIENTGTDAFEFQAATVAHILTRDVTTEHAEQVKILGLMEQTALNIDNLQRPAVADIEGEYMHPVGEAGALVVADGSDAVAWAGVHAQHQGSARADRTHAVQMQRHTAACGCMTVCLLAPCARCIASEVCESQQQVHAV